MALTNDEMEFERQKLCYAENSEHARHLNTQLNAIPALAVTVTGGLWFGAAATKNLVETVRFGLLTLAGLSDVVLILAAFRIRNVFESHLEAIEAFYPQAFPAETPSKAIFPSLTRYSMVKMYCGLILIAALASFIGAFTLYWPAANKWIVPGILALLLMMSGSWILVIRGWRKSLVICGLGFLLIAAIVGTIAHRYD